MTSLFFEQLWARAPNEVDIRARMGGSVNSVRSLLAERNKPVILSKSEKDKWPRFYYDDNAFKIVKYTEYEVKDTGEKLV